MAAYWNSNSMGTLFSSLNTSGISGMSSLFSDYNSIRNGSYGKLLKSYYGNVVGSSTGRTSSKSSETTNVLDKILKERHSPTVSKEVSKANSALSQSVPQLKNSISSLQKSATYEDTAGGTSGLDKTKAALKDFVSNYNDTVSSAKKSTNQGMTSNVAAMMRTTEANKDKLAEIGITKNYDGTISFNEKKLQTADLSKVQDLFTQDNALSYGSTIASRIRGAGYYTTGSAKTSADTGTITETQTSSAKLMDNLNAFQSDSLFAKLKDSNGNETDQYDKDKITSTVKSFVENYNKTVSSGKMLNNSNAAASLSRIMEKTSGYSDALRNMGISINNNGTLSLDEETFKNSDMSQTQKDLKKYGWDISINVSLLNHYSKSQASSSSTYTAGGGYSSVNSPSYTGSV